tara:strand:- start:48 stop:758 length:711 start_codon:yes stop_codon:yes gene_type:complete
MSIINEAMIFAAGFGKRMLPYTKNTPKPLLKIKGKSIIHYQIDALLKLNFKNIVVNVHHLSSKLERDLECYEPFVRVTFEEKILETGGGLLNALKLKLFEDPTSPKVVINGDVFWKNSKNCPIDKIIKNWKSNMDILLALKRKNLVLGYEGKGDFGLKTKEKTSNLFRNSVQNEYMFTGLQIIKPKIIEKEKKTKFSLREIYFKLIAKKTIYGFVDENEWYHISKEVDYKRVNEIV